MDAYGVGLKRAEEANSECRFLLASKTTLETASQGDYCGRLSLVGEDFSPNALSYVLPLDSPYTSDFSKVTLELQRKDQIVHATDFSTTSPCVPKVQSQLTWSQLRVFFYVSYGCLGLMAVFMWLGTLLKVAKPNVSRRARDLPPLPGDEKLDRPAPEVIPPAVEEDRVRRLTEIPKDRPRADRVVHRTPPRLLSALGPNDSSSEESSSFEEETSGDGGSIESTLERLDLRVRQTLGLLMSPDHVGGPVEAVGLKLREDISMLLGSRPPEGAIGDGAWRDVSKLSARVREWIMEVVKTKDGGPI